MGENEGFRDENRLHSQGSNALKSQLTCNMGRSGYLSSGEKKKFFFSMGEGSGILRV